MKYMIFTSMTQATWDDLSAAEHADPARLRRLGDFLERFERELTESGELVDSAGFDAPAQMRRIQLRDGASAVTVGPTTEAEEVLAGYWVVECGGIGRATEIAERLNHAPGPIPSAGIVVRQVGESVDE